MKTKKKISASVFIIAIFISILYLFLAPRPLAKEYQFVPVWKISTLTPAAENTTNNKNLFFSLGQSLGYFTEDGKITNYQTFPEKSSISNTYYALYTSDAVNTPFYHSDGTQAGTIKASGFPYFVEDQIFVFLPGGASLAKCDSDGNVVWLYEGTVPITAFSAKKEFVGLGFADGSIKELTSDNGTCILNYAPGGSDYPVILGLDISENGEYIASVSGHEQQRFVLCHREENQPKIIYHAFLKDGMPYQTLVHFTQDGKRVIFNYQNNIGIYNLETQKENTIAVKTRLLSIKETDNLVFLLGRDKSEYTVYMIEKSNKLEGSFSFTADTAFIQTNGEDLFVGKDNTISRISIERE